MDHGGRPCNKFLHNVKIHVNPSNQGTDEWSILQGFLVIRLAWRNAVLKNVFRTCLKIVLNEKSCIEKAQLQYFNIEKQ